MNYQQVASFLYSLRINLIILIIALLQGCSAVEIQDDTDNPPMHTLESLGVTSETVFAVDIYDPWEGMNRRIYNFNAQLDDYLLLPVIYGYKAYVPKFARLGIHNFYNNLITINHTVNAALQLKGHTTLNNGLRFISNSTLGLAGFIDVATGMGFPDIQEDFGQVLGHWGAGPGPYLVLPFLGPSNLRDTAGLGVDSMIASWYLDELGMNQGSDAWIYLYYALLGIDRRANTDFRYHDSLTPFEYDFIRMMYTAQRRILIGE